MQVWNKNRRTSSSVLQLFLCWLILFLAAPPPSTKHLTDEELKQQYGIHMTSRIQADGEGKEAKWADIDDDEDDWAPETIEWNDGTKVTLNHTDVVPPPGQSINQESSEAQPKLPQPVKSAPTVTSSVGPNATILRLGANAERQQAQKAAILQKGPVEKPIQLTAKSPAPPPTKSPWAALPPVEKVSPIPINPQMSMAPPTRYFANQSFGQSPSAMNTPSPAKEISADDFNRSWRDSQTTQPRELYMPNSGRYETVNEGRRRGSRNDQQFRATALLQRPSQSDQHTPAEPSAAFQTHRTGNEQDRAPWTRRRASSTISGGSGHAGRRLSLTKSGDVAPMPSDVSQQRRGSQVPGSDSIDSPQDMPTMQFPNEPYQARGPSPAYDAAKPPGSSVEPGQTSASTTSATVDLEAEREVQRRLMREKREVAIKRRKEEEDRLEAEKKERIRLKLEAMGPPPEPKSKAREQKAEKIPEPDKSPEMPRFASSRPKPPIPEATGEPKQYGLMKVHHPDSIRKLNSSSDRQVDVPATSELNSVPQVKREPSPPMPKVLPPLLNGARPASDPLTQQRRQSPQHDVLSEEHDSPSPTGSVVGPEAKPGWGGPRADHRSQPQATLWGPPSNKQALGNGTFDQNLAGFPSRDLQSHIKPSYPQEAWISGHRALSEISPQLGYIPKEVVSDKTQPVPSYTFSEERPLAADSEVDSPRPISKPAPIGPPQAHIPVQRWQASATISSATNGVAAWNNFPSVAAREDRAEDERNRRELVGRLEEEAKTGVRRAPQYTFEETWKQVEMGDQAGQRQITGVSKANVSHSDSPAHQFGPVGSMSGIDHGSRMMNGMPTRGSRFFPPAPDGVSNQSRRAITYNHPMMRRSPSPPPAEEGSSDHPAYTGNILQPVVHFPPQKAIVKLPPRPSTPPPTAPLSYSAAVMTQPQPSLRQVSTPIAQTPNWQDRFNGLLGTKPVIKKQVLAVTSSTREPLDVPLTKFSASVSLPQRGDENIKDAGKVTSKDVEDEEEMFEDREAASLPSVRIPSKARYASWKTSRGPNLRYNSKSDRFSMVDPISTRPFMVERWVESRINEPRELFAIVRLPGSTKPKKCIVQQKGAPNASGSGGSQASSLAAHNHNNSKNKNGVAKPRDASTNHPRTSLNSKNKSSPAVVSSGSVSSPRSGLHNNRPSKNWSKRRAQIGMAH